MKEKDLVCICCPMGCILQISGNYDKILVSGNQCRRGEIYAKKEITDPVRTLTGTVRVKGGDLILVPVKTDKEIPKDKIFECMDLIHNTQAIAPVVIGDIIIKNAAGTGANIVATKAVQLKKRLRLHQ